jgi:thioredoxin 1
MNQPTNQGSFSTPWLLILGLLLGGGFLVFMAWESIRPASNVGNKTSTSVMEFTAANWQREVVESKIPVLVDVTATWCEPCRILAPTINELAQRYQGKVKVGKLDADANATIVNKLGVTGFPTVLIFKGGERPLSSIRGLKSKESYVSAIDAVLAEQ